MYSYFHFYTVSPLWKQSCKTEAVLTLLLSIPVKNKRVASQKSSHTFLFLSQQEKHLHRLATQAAHPKSLFINQAPQPLCQPSAQRLWGTHPNVFITLYELWMSKETPLQDGLHQGEVHHVQQKQPQNGQVYDDCHLENASTVYAKIVTFPHQSHNRQQGPKDDYKQSLIFGSVTRGFKTQKERKTNKL